MLQPPYASEVADLVVSKVFTALAPIKLLRALSNQPDVARAFRAMANVVLFQLSIAERDREIAIIRTGALTRSEYEWGMHVRIYAQRCGLDEVHIQELTCSATWQALPDAHWSAHDKLIVRMVDELHHYSTISDETWALLEQQWSIVQIVELLFSSSFYHVAAFFLNAAAVPLEDGAARFPAGVRQACVPSSVRAALPQCDVTTDQKGPKSERVPLRYPPFQAEEAQAAEQLIGSQVFQGLSPVKLRRALANHVALGTAFQQLAHVVLFQLSIAERDREIAIIRTGALTRSEYEWGMHVSIYAQRCGLAALQIQELTCSSSWHELTAAHWSADDKLIVRMVDELHHHSTVSDQTWQQLAARWSHAQIVELLLASSFYHMAAFFLNAAAVPLEEGAERFPDGIGQACVP